MFVCLGLVDIPATGSYLILIKQIDYLIGVLFAPFKESNKGSYISALYKVSYSPFLENLIFITWINSLIILIPQLSFLD